MGLGCLFEGEGVIDQEFQDPFLKPDIETLNGILHGLGVSKEPIQVESGDGQIMREEEGAIDRAGVVSGHSDHHQSTVRAKTA